VIERRMQSAAAGPTGTAIRKPMIAPSIGERDRIEGEARNVHRALQLLAAKRRGGDTSRSCAATSCSSRSPIARVASSTA
jgi:hypothetical protein